MASKLAQKIAETRAAIADLQRRMEVHQIKLAAYLELEGKPAASTPHKAVEKQAKRNKLFEPTIPWERALATLRSKFGAGILSTNDMTTVLVGLGHRQVTGSTVRDKLRKLTKKGILVRVDEGRYRFAVVAEKRAA